MGPLELRTVAGVGGDGILSGSIDSDGPRHPRRTYPVVVAAAGMTVKQRGTPLVGIVAGCSHERVLVRARDGREHACRLVTGGFEVEGRAVTLAPPRARAYPDPVRTASGSVAAPARPPRVARAGRILVEGIHDAELVERVWGDDLREEGVVVEPLHGADGLAAVVRRFGPGPGRRLGVLLDHLVDGSKEARIAASVDHPDVVITGHPYVDVWQAVKPRVIGIDRWPDIPPGQLWKEGVIAALGRSDEPRDFWRWLLGRVEDWTDLETPLIGAVEQLIDHVTVTAEYI